MVVGSADAGFFDPNSAWVSTPATDIFSLGSVSYTRETGRNEAPAGCMEQYDRMLMAFSGTSKGCSEERLSWVLDRILEDG